MYRVVDEKREILTNDFDVPTREPIEFERFLPEEHRDNFEQISTARLDPRFAAKNDSECKVTQASLLADKETSYFIDVIPKAGTLVLFDSVSLPHLVREVTSDRQRVDSTGWFHEDSEFFLVSSGPAFFRVQLAMKPYSWLTFYLLSLTTKIVKCHRRFQYSHY